MIGRYGAQRGSMRIWEAIQAGYWQIRKARMPESTMEIVRPVRKTFRPWLSWEKAQEAAEKAGSGEQQRAGEKGAFFFGKIGTEQHKSSPRTEILLQDMRFRPESELA